MPLNDVLARWHDFYALLGTAAATLVGLLFVAASVSGGVFSGAQRAPLRVFLTASVVNFSSVLAACLVLLAPVARWELLGGLIVACALCGLVYSGMAWRDTVRDGLIVRIDLEDRAWYMFLPIVGYLCEAGSGVAIVLGLSQGCTVLAVSTGLLLAVGIHNAWDITVWSTITRRRD